MASFRSKIILWTKQNDILIKELILTSEDYDIRPDGTIWTRISKNGAGFLPDNAWRRADFKNDKGYRSLNFKLKRSQRNTPRSERSKKFQVHRIIYAKYKGKLNPTKVINHIDGNPENNHPDNLEQISIKENNDHKLKVLKHNPRQNVKIGWDGARKIRKLKAEGKTHKEIGEMFDISKGHVSEVVNNKIWIE